MWIAKMWIAICWSVNNGEWAKSCPRREKGYVMVRRHPRGTRSPWCSIHAGVSSYRASRISDSSRKAMESPTNGITVVILSLLSQQSSTLCLWTMVIWWIAANLLDELYSFDARAAACGFERHSSCDMAFQDMLCLEEWNSEWHFYNWEFTRSSSTVFSERDDTRVKDERNDNHPLTA